MPITITHTTQIPADSCIDVGKPEIWNDSNVAEMTVPAGTIVGNIGVSDGPADPIDSADMVSFLASGSGGGTSNFLRADGTWAAPSGGGGGSATTVEVDLGSAKSSGKFTITDAAIGGSSKVLCWQAPGPYTGKGTRADEASMQPVQVIAVEPGSGTATVYWQTPPVVVLASFRGRLAPNTGNGTLANSGTNRDITETPRRIGLVKGNVKFSYMVMN